MVDEIPTTDPAGSQDRKILVARCLLLLAGVTIGWYWTAAIWLGSLAVFVLLFRGTA